MRPRSRTTTIAATAASLALLAVPALAAGPPLADDRGPASAAQPLADAGVLGDAERRAASRTAAATGSRGARRPLARQLVHPLAAKPDYGSAAAGFGAARSGHVHAGQDVFAPTGTPLVAVAGGVVVEAGSDAGRGNHVAIFDPKRERTYVYFHMVDRALVAQGERVGAGQRVGAVGCTGSCWGEHLHFEIRQGRDPYGPAIDPLPLLREWQRAPGVR